eukprot:gnl/TRDRNA2_/TRDRNA2_174840_c0_seq2.p1 gnl/TRDRNA2_/TRDRNA2_174840_c0~~gnl/TRDRNA2_/TRDRNA2_174840_c0_seq2.p1  ORF type:complete len:307 (+),score=28.36 gnl/TRDRNA2_/TRDRNA2_174840_c0_seq2:52-972(+)
MFVILYHASRRSGARSAVRSSSLDIQRDTPSPRERIRQAVARNRMLPRFAGSFLETRHNIWGTCSKRSRWVVLDPAAGTLTLWDRPPAEDQIATGHDGDNNVDTQRPRDLACPNFREDLCSTAHAGDAWHCSICLEGEGTAPADAGPVIQLTLCCHQFHRGCLARWCTEGANGATCPACRMPLHAMDLDLLTEEEGKNEREEGCHYEKKEEPLPPSRPRQMSSCWPSRSPRPRKVMRLIRLLQVDFNIHSCTTFLQFRGGPTGRRNWTMILTAENREDFYRWQCMLESYDAGPDRSWSTNTIRHPA